MFRVWNVHVQIFLNLYILVYSVDKSHTAVIIVHNLLILVYGTAEKEKILVSSVLLPKSTFS